MNNVKREFELYEPMMNWLEEHLSDKYPKSHIITIDAHAESLDRVLKKAGIICDEANGLDIQIDILGVVEYKNQKLLYFIEAKKTQLNLHDLGQLCMYCKLINPEGAFLLSSKGLGSLDKIFRIQKREDLLVFGIGKRIKRMQVGKWDVTKGVPDLHSIYPKM